MQVKGCERVLSFSGNMLVVVSTSTYMQIFVHGAQHVSAIMHVPRNQAALL